MDTLFWVVLGFLAGSIPFSVWLGRLLLRADIRRYGDGNPGAANAWRAGGWPVGLLAVLLDYLKGAIPVGFAHFSLGMHGPALAAMALAPVMGHAFSPFLRFRGGKAVAVTFGIWTGLTLGEVPILLGVLLGVFFFMLAADSWSVMLGMAGVLVHLLLRGHAPILLAVWAGNTLILAWKHRASLRLPFRFRPWLQRMVGGPQ
ncbi:MAG: glycerol-3-phosphate acyltransferase [Anaerolineales bacterium]